MPTKDVELLHAVRTSFFIAAVVSAALYGVYVVLAAATIWKFYKSTFLPRSTVRSTTVIIFALALLFTANLAAITHIAHASLTQLPCDLPKWSLPGMLFTITIALAIGDAVFIYRCWIIWSRSRWVWLPITLLTAELCGAAVELEIMIHGSAESLFRQRRGPVDDKRTAIGAATVSLTIALNLILAAAAICRLLVSRRHLRRNALPAGGAHYSRISRVVAISTLLYSAGWLPVIFYQYGVFAPPYFVALFALVATMPLVVMLHTGSGGDGDTPIVLPRIDSEPSYDRIPMTLDVYKADRTS